MDPHGEKCSPEKIITSIIDTIFFVERKKMYKIIFKSISLLFICFPLLAGEFTPDQSTKPKEESPVFVEKWLMAGPAILPLPAPVSEQNKVSVKNLLDRDILNPANLWIEEGDIIKWTPERNLHWKTQKTTNGKLELSVKNHNPNVAFLVCYLDCSRWQKTKMKIETDHSLTIFLDGIQVIPNHPLSKAEGKKTGTVDADLVLSQGKHSLLITTVWDPKGDPSWTVKTSFYSSNNEYLRLSLSTKRTLTEDDIFNSRSFSNVSITPDGKAVSYIVQQRNPRTQESESWFEIRKISGSEIEKVIRDSQGFKNISWSPNAKTLSAIVPGEDGTSDLWLINRVTGEVTVLLDNVIGLGNAIWSPTGAYIIYSVLREPKNTDLKIQKVNSIDDRYPSFIHEANYYIVMIDSKVSRRLTTGFKSASRSGEPFSISPNGKQIQFIYNGYDIEKGGFHFQEFLILDLEKNIINKCFTSHLRDYDPGGLRSCWSSDGKSIYFVGSQSVKNPAFHNEHYRDLYILNSQNSELKCLTDNFVPSVIRMKYCPKGESIFILCQEKSRIQLYKTDRIGKQIRKLNTGVDVIKDFDVSDDGEVIVFSGESITTPAKFFTMNSNGGSPRLLFSPDKERWENVVFGKVEDFDFKNTRGDSIEGYLYYPADFSSSKKYPLVVFYYGGVSPTSRNFNPKLLAYVSSGYFVYVLNPSGASGFGAEFADLSVNDWGEIVTEDIISGVKKVVKSKPYIDSKRIGAQGRSQGGATTNLLAYKTDLFRALISTSSISNIAGQWGVGTWGYSYLGFLLAESYPWNRRDIYVDRSPIFHADKMNTPLLLLHGVTDTNVPISQADQLYTALKFLGKEVEYVRFIGEGHSVRGTDENRRILPQIRLAWWDKYLKDQPEAWNYFYMK